jgi:hypothetical protein
MAREPEPADEDFEDGETSRIRTIDTIAEKIERLEDIVTNALGGHGQAHATAQKITQRRLGEPGEITAEVQRELARRDAATKREEEAARLGRVEEAVKALAEKPPEAPVRKIEHLMGWHG